jgi:diguanylate cyclase (GGDEF)-like protein/PAS domain S-box-containing protein
MLPQLRPHSDDAETQVSEPRKALGEAERRLQELTAREVQALIDSEGKSRLLERALIRLRQAEARKQAAIIDALPANIVLLDTQGVIVSANASWRHFADANELSDPQYGLGDNYLEICDNATGEHAFGAAQVAAGIRSVLDGAAKVFSFEYPCDSPLEKRWFLLTVTPMDDERPVGVVAMHLNITARKRGEDELRRFAAAMDASPDGIFLLDRTDMAVVHVNEAGCRMYSLERHQVLALRPWEVINESRETLEKSYDDLIAGRSLAQSDESLLQRVNAAPIWIERRRHAQRIGERWTIVVVVRDVTARREADSRIAYLNRVHTVLSRINTLIVRVRDRGELFREACRIAVEDGALAMSWIGMVDRHRNIVVPLASAGMPEQFFDALTRRLELHSIASPGDSLSARAITEKRPIVSNDSPKDPAIHFSEMHAKLGVHSIAILPLIVADEAVGVIVLYAREGGFFHEAEMRLLTELAGDVAFAVDHIEKQERLDYLAYYDVVTGLANRHLLLERLTQYRRSAATGGHKLALFLIDLQRFKSINDSLGRVAGDALLRQVANWLTLNAGDANLVARIDADRFAMILPKVADEEEVARILDRTLQAFMDHSFELNEASYRLAVKIGVVLFPDDGADADTLCKHAEAALKKAKRGGDRYLFYAPKMTESVAARLNLENQLRRALELDEYVLHYQPKVDLASGKLVGTEALIRWNDPATGLVPPSRFIPVLEETGLIYEVGRWALHKAMEDYLRWRSAGLPVVRIAVNLSPLQLRNRDFIADIKRAIGVEKDAAAGLELELTESLIMEDVKLSIARLQAIRALGVRVAIDDFGTGFSSLSYLRKLPIDTLKIDRSFIVDMVSGPEGLSLVSIIIKLAHSFKLRVVAEGVETEEQSRLLRLLDCDEMQGFLVSKPLPAALFEQTFLAAPTRAAASAA